MAPSGSSRPPPRTPPMAGSDAARCYRAWLRFVAEFPDWRWDLKAKLDYFICWRLAGGPRP